MNKTLAIIPARGGSKRIPRKNIRLFKGKPIIHYAIENCFKSGLFDEVMVSTDDQEIKSIAEKAGAKVPFLRSSENSNDFAGTMEVIKEVIESYAKIGTNFESFCCLYPTTPLLNKEYLMKAYNLLSTEDLDFVVSINEFGFPIQRALVKRSHRIEMLWPENYKVRSQDLEKTFHDAGQFYFGKIASAKSLPTLLSGNVGSVEIPRILSQDIDTIDDWIIAEQKFDILNLGKA